MYIVNVLRAKRKEGNSNCLYYHPLYIGLHTEHAVYSLAPNGPEKWGCKLRIRDLFSKVRDLFSKIRDLFSNTRLRDQKNSRCT